MSAGTTEIKALFPKYEIVHEGTVTHGECEYWLVKTNKEEVPDVVLLKGFPDGEPDARVVQATLAEIGATPTGIVSTHGDVCSFSQHDIDENVMKWDDEYLIVAVTV